MTDLSMATQQQFYQPEGLIYLDGNSLGMLPQNVPERLQQVIQQQWGEHLINGWNQHGWLQLPLTVGDKLAPLVGAAPGQMICCDSISIHLFKLLAAALAAQPERREIVSSADNFPTDLYMAQGLQQFLGNERCQLRLVAESDLLDAISAQTAVVLVTEVNFRSGRRLDIAALSARAHQLGARIIVDLAHSAGALPVALDDWQVDYAVGCTYKYLNAGPGAPAFAYVAKRHQSSLQQPLQGWLGHADPFAFQPNYQPAEDIRSLLTGTPSILALAAVDAALEAFAGVNMTQLQQQALALADQFHQRLSAAGLIDQFERLTPFEPQARGSQLSYAHPHAYAICQAWIEAGVIADFRAPNVLRLGITPLYLSAYQVALAADKLIVIMQTQRYLDARYQQRRGAVT